MSLSNGVLPRDDGFVAKKALLGHGSQGDCAQAQCDYSSTSSLREIPPARDRSPLGISAKEITMNNAPIIAQRVPLNQRISTPWGVADYVQQISTGIIQVSTPSHGGFGLSRDRYAAMHPAFQIHGELPAQWYANSWIWFEEDCEACLVLDSFLGEINNWRRSMNYSEIRLEDTAKTLIDYFPDAYEQRYNIQLKPGESRVKDHRLFMVKHANDYIVITAFSGRRQHVPDGFVGVIASIGGNRSSEKVRRFLIPEHEYNQRSLSGFVVDLGRHQCW